MLRSLLAGLIPLVMECFELFAMVFFDTLRDVVEWSRRAWAFMSRSLVIECVGLSAMVFFGAV